METTKDMYPEYMKIFYESIIKQSNRKKNVKKTLKSLHSRWKPR